MSDWFEFVQAIYKCLRAYHFLCEYVYDIYIFNCYPGPAGFAFCKRADRCPPVSHYNI